MRVFSAIFFRFFPPIFRLPLTPSSLSFRALGWRRWFLTRVILAERATALRVEALALEVLLAHRAVETLAVVIIVQGLHPAISSFDWESARETLCREQLVPISFAVGQSLFEEEWAVAEELATVGTFEAVRVEMLSNRVQAIAFDLVVAFAASRRDEALETVLAVELSLFLHEPYVLKRSTTLSVHANEVVRAPDLPQGGDKRPPDVRVAMGAEGHSRSRSRCLIQDPPSTLRRGAASEGSALGPGAAEAADSGTGHSLALGSRQGAPRVH